MGEALPAFDEAGDGPPLVLIHGHPFNRTMWRPQLRSLSAELRVIAPDLPGYGASPGRGSRVTMPEFAAAIVELADHLGLALVVAGDHDAYADEAVVAQLVGALPAPEVVQLPGTGHLPNLEAPAAFDAALAAVAGRVLAA